MSFEVAHPDRVSFEKLEFIRTARINQASAWIWRFEDDGESYLTVIRKGMLRVVMGAQSNWAGLTPEQHLVALYAGRDLYRG